MAIIHKIMKTFTRPDGDDVVQYEIVDDNGRKMIAPNWYEHEEDAFTAGQHIEKDGVLYRFLAPHTAETAWNSNEVTAVDVGEEIEAIVTDLNQKASKVSGATNGNFAALDGNGNLTDSGKKPSDFLTEHQDISGKADKDTDAVEGNFAAFDSNGNPIDSGHKHSDYLTSHQDISGKADKVTGGTADNLAALDASGNLKDSGTSATELKSQIDGKAPLIFDTVTNVPIASVSDTTAAPVKSLIIGIEPKQAGTGDPSPSNVRPITGWDAVVLSQSGKNLFNPSNIALMTVGDNANERYGVSIEGVGTYIVRATQTGNSAYIYVKVKNANGTYGSASSLVGSSGYYGEITKTLTEGQKLLIYDYSNDTEATAKTKLTSWGIYVAVPTTHTADLPSTVFGGQIDWVGAECADELTLFEFDGSEDESWVANGANGYYITVDVGYKTEQTPIANYLVCLSNGASSGLGTWQGRMNPITSTEPANFLVKPDMAIYDTLAKWKTYLSNNPLHVLLKKAVATEITLTGLDEISTMLGGGTMNVWADSGDIVKMTYPCDTKGYIDKRIAELQALILENT